MPKKGENKHIRAHQECKRCGYTRAELSKGLWESRGVTGVCFNKGFCPTCYNLLRLYWWDEDMVDVHEITQLLKKCSREKKGYK